MAANYRASLSNGVGFPLLGFGTFQLKDPQIVHNALDAALASGYRLIDTASIYRNEHIIGESLRELAIKHKLEPSEIFITTKLGPSATDYKSVLLQFDASLKALGRSYVDLYLIHWPGVQGRPREDPENAVVRKERWRAMEELFKADKIKAIGISNYTVQHLEEMMTYATVKPHVLQSECHPLLHQNDVRKFCKEHEIFFQAYTSLGRGDAKLLKNDRVLSVASHYPGKTPAQVLLAWALQQGMGVIPKASSADRIKENRDAVDLKLSQKDMDVLNAMKETYRVCWDPTDVA